MSLRQFVFETRILYYIDVQFYPQLFFFIDELNDCIVDKKNTYNMYVENLSPNCMFKICVELLNV